MIASVDVERHARDFMEAAKKLQLYFIGLEREDQPTKAESLRKVMPITVEFPIYLLPSLGLHLYVIF